MYVNTFTYEYLFAMYQKVYHKNVRKDRCMTIHQTSTSTTPVPILAKETHKNNYTSSMALSQVENGRS